MKMLVYFALVLGVSINSFANSDITNEVKNKLESLNVQRETLANSLNNIKDPITEDHFKQVCMPVGKEFKTWGEKQGYKVRQISLKNRNPSNEVKSSDQKIYKSFIADNKLKDHSEKQTLNEIEGTIYYYRINVAKACLHCHGAKDQRPQFIKDKYPNDKAYDFKIGELRGLYSVFVPKNKNN